MMANAIFVSAPSFFLTVTKRTTQYYTPLRPFRLFCLIGALLFARMAYSLLRVMSTAALSCVVAAAAQQQEPSSHARGRQTCFVLRQTCFVLFVVYNLLWVVRCLKRLRRASDLLIDQFLWSDECCVYDVAGESRLAFEVSFCCCIYVLPLLE